MNFYCTNGIGLRAAKLADLVLPITLQLFSQGSCTQRDGHLIIFQNLVMAGWSIWSTHNAWLRTSSPFITPQLHLGSLDSLSLVPACSMA